MENTTTYYKLECVDPHFTGAFGMYRFENGISLWVNWRKKDTMLAAGSARRVVDSCECWLTQPYPFDEQDARLHNQEWKLLSVEPRVEKEQPSRSSRNKTPDIPVGPIEYKRYPLDANEFEKKLHRRMKTSSDLAEELGTTYQAVNRWTRLGVPSSKTDAVWCVFEKWDREALDD